MVLLADVKTFPPRESVFLHLGTERAECIVWCY